MLGLGDPGRKKQPHARFDGAPRIFRKKCRFCPTRDAFWEKPWGAVKKSVSCTFSPGSSSFNAELQCDVSFFQNLSVGPSYAAFRTGRFRRDCPKLGNVYVRKGGNFPLPSQILTLFLFEIGWKFWFCYQTWSNSMNSPSSGRSTLTENALRAQNHYVTLIKVQNIRFVSYTEFGMLRTKS